MIHMRTSILFIIFGFFHGGLFQETSLKAHPVYAVIGPGANSPAVLECTISGDFEYSSTVYSSWLLEDTTLLAFNNISLKSETIIPSNDYTARKMLLTLTKPHLDNADRYICQLIVKGVTYKTTVDLHINQLPTVSLKQLKTFVVEEETSTVSACHAALSKPASTMWYENQNGEKLVTNDVVSEQTCSNDVVNSSLALTRSFTRSDQQNSYFCVISHPNRTTPYRLQVPFIDIYYAPSAEMAYPESASTVVRPEKISFEARCITKGNPSPDIKWSFAPDVIDNNDDNSNSIDNSSKIPKDFVLTEEDHRLFSPALHVMTENQATNNGTFTCIATNVVGSDSDHFSLQVYALPPTTVPTTTTVTPEPQSGPMSAAVIAGVVAVAVFIVIIVVILLLRYFMSHKGEYYTNELKSADARNSESFEEEDGLPACEEDLLGERKRKEHFL